MAHSFSSKVTRDPPTKDSARGRVRLPSVIPYPVIRRNPPDPEGTLPSSDPRTASASVMVQLRTDSPNPPSTSVRRPLLLPPRCPSAVGTDLWSWSDPRSKTLSSCETARLPARQLTGKICRSHRGFQDARSTVVPGCCADLDAGALARVLLRTQKPRAPAELSSLTGALGFQHFTTGLRLGAAPTQQYQRRRSEQHQRGRLWKRRSSTHVEVAVGETASGVARTRGGRIRG